MLNDVLEALEMLKRDKSLSREVTDTISFIREKGENQNQRELFGFNGRGRYVLP